MKRWGLFLAVVISVSFLPLSVSTAQQTNILPNGATYIGEMKDGVPNGQGMCAFADGEKYIGTFKNGHYDGQGTYTIDGSKYIGEWKDGKYDGQGTFTSPNGSNLQGEWRDDRPYRTSGTLVQPDETVEVGTWNHDKTKSGATIRWKDGRRYQGDWKVVDGSTDLPDGHGKMTYGDGHVEEGQWKEGKFIGAEKSP